MRTYCGWRRRVPRTEPLRLHYFLAHGHVDIHARASPLGYATKHGTISVASFTTTPNAPLKAPENAMPVDLLETSPPKTRLACLRIFFTDRHARAMDRASWAEIQGALQDPAKSPLLRQWKGWELRRLEALLWLLARYYPELPTRPERVTSAADIVRRFLPNCRDLKTRTIWVVCVDELGQVHDDVLAVMGGHESRLPPLRTLMRHALMKGAVGVWIADFRPIELVEVDDRLTEALGHLDKLGGCAGLDVHDWIVLGRENARSAREHLRRAPSRTVREAA